MASTAITGELIWPSQNDIYGASVGGSAGDGMKLLELQHRKLLGGGARRNNYVISGGLLPATDADLTITVPAGLAIIEGHFCQWPNTDITLPASNTSYIFVKLVYSGTLVTGLEIEDNTSGTPPASSLQLGTATTSGSAVTSSTDTRRLGPSTVEMLTSGTSYIPKAGVYRMYVELFGGGGGGGGGGGYGGNGSNGVAGGNTTFNSGAYIAAGGALGSGGTPGVIPGADGTATGGSLNLTGKGMPGGRGGGTGSDSQGRYGPNGMPAGSGGYCAFWLDVTPGSAITYAIGGAGTGGNGATTDDIHGGNGQDGQAGRIVIHS